MDSKKKIVNVRLVKGKRKARAKPKEKTKTKQKQKQRQVVNVQVSSGGSGGGGFIPVPQAPAFDYSLLANLIRPANTVDMPIRAMAPIPEPVQVRPAEEPTLADAKVGGEKAMTEVEKEVKARKREPGETDEQYNKRIARYEQYLANKSARGKAATFEKKKAEVLSKLPVGEAQAIPGGGATFVGEGDVYALGEK